MVYAGFWIRAMACLIDGLVMTLLSIVLFFPTGFWPLSILITVFYRVVFETSSLSATPGKALMKIAVVKKNGQPLSVRDSLIRYLASWISSAFFFLGYLISFFTEKRQTFHDLVAETVVIEKEFDEYKFFQVFLDQSKALLRTPPPKEPLAPTTTLEELYRLHEKGILSEEEYRIKKEELLKKL